MGPDTSQPVFIIPSAERAEQRGLSMLQGIPPFLNGFDRWPITASLLKLGMLIAGLIPTGLSQFG